MGVVVACPACKGPVFGPRHPGPSGETGVLTAPDSIHCPDCASENCQRVQVMHDMGTSKLSGRAFSTGGVGLGIGAALTSISGTAQHKLAAECAPPVVPPECPPAGAGAKFGACLIAGGLGSFVLPFLMDTASFAARVPWFLGFGGVAVVSGLSLIYFCDVPRQNEMKRLRQSRQAEAYAEWQSKFICLKCGRVWIPQ